MASSSVSGIQQIFGDFDVTPEVVSGPEEADLSFSGATGDLDQLLREFFTGTEVR